MSFFPNRSFKIMPIAVGFVLIILLLALYVFCIANNQGKIMMSVIIIIICPLVLYLTFISDKDGIYLDSEFIIWKKFFISKRTNYKDIKGIVILHNITQKAAFGTTVPVYETKKTNDGNVYIYGMVLIDDLEEVDFNYSSNELFIKYNKNVVVGYAIYNQILMDKLLEKNRNIKILKGQLRTGTQEDGIIN